MYVCDVLMLMSRSRAFAKVKESAILFLARKPFSSDFFFFNGTKTRDAGRIDKKAIDGGESKSVR